MLLASPALCLPNVSTTFFFSSFFWSVQFLLLYACSCAFTFACACACACAFACSFAFCFYFSLIFVLLRCLFAGKNLTFFPSAHYYYYYCPCFRFCLCFFFWRCFSSKGNLTTAVAYYREAIRLCPEFADAHSNLGNVLKARNKEKGGGGGGGIMMLKCVHYFPNRLVCTLK